MRTSDAPTDAFLHLVDTLDAEANVVTHAVVRAQATVRSMVEDLQALVHGDVVDDRVLAQVGVRLLQHRATLIEALASLRRCDPDVRMARSIALEVATLPDPPRTNPRPPSRPRPEIVRIPPAPQPRRFVLAELPAPPK